MKRFLLIFALVSFFLVANAQSTSMIPFLIVGADTTTVEEFEMMYKKNVLQTQDPSNRQSIEDYLQLYINFRLKVQAAIEAGYDTNDIIQAELNTYRVQAAEPYLIDQKVKAGVSEQAYEHMKYDIRARHILIEVDADASDADTLAAYKKILDLRNKILNGEDFAKMAFEYGEGFSKSRSRGGERKFTTYEGDLGYFTAFGMLYPLESAAYSQSIGDISMPIKTKYGYHILQVLDKKPALGKFDIAVIAVVERSEDTTAGAKAAVMDKIDEAYDLLQKGESFESVAKRYSEDRTAANGGLLLEMSIDKVFPEIVKVLHEIKEGEYSAPIKTRIGWYIVKLINKTGVGSFESVLPDIEYKISRDNEYRSMIPIRLSAERLMKENNMKEDIALYSQFKKIVTNDILKGAWKYDSSQMIYGKTLITYAGDNILLRDFAQYIVKKQKRIKSTKEKEIDRLYEAFKITNSFDREVFNLDNKYPEFKALMKEYRDGVFLFDLMNEKVWAKASVDTVGLYAFFEKNKNKYMWPEEVEATLITYDVRNISTQKVKKIVEKAYAAGKRHKEELQAALYSKLGEGIVLVEQGSFPKGSNALIDNATWEEGLSRDLLSGETTKGYAIIHSVIPRRYKELDEIRGGVITDYQAYLDEEWTKELRAKYPIIINEEALNSLYKR